MVTIFSTQVTRPRNWIVCMVKLRFQVRSPCPTRFSPACTHMINTSHSFWLQDPTSEEQPPSYMDFKQSTPTYQPWGSSSQLPYPIAPGRAGVQAPGAGLHAQGAGPQDMEIGSYGTIAQSQAALTGIPFTLAPHLQKIVSVTAGIDRLPGGRLSSYDSTKYEYDFELEMRVLSEHAALE